MRVLVSARDPAAARCMVPVLQAAQRVPGFEAIVVAQPPASDELRRQGFPAEVLDAPVAASVQSLDFDRVLRAADAVLRRHRPQAILTGMSGPGVGIDEALLARSSATPTFTIQDFGGSAAPPAGCVAQTYFVGDDETARKFDKLGVRTIVVGPLQYIGFPTEDPARHRNAGRPGPAITFFGQPQWHMEGYGRALASLARAAKARWPRTTVTYRPHPKETPADEERAQKLFTAADAPLAVDRSASFERALAEPDLVVTCFSACGLDHVVMHSKSSKPLGSVLYLMTHEDLRAHVLADTGEPAPWPALRGLALMAREEAEVAPLMERALAPAEQLALWRKLSSGTGLRAPRPDLVLDTICGRA